ncbi:MAG: PD-(D/E)XK nuclease family protein [Chloroflexota bacterium]|nr:PD-(D/E)XK nuclease family protein [Chloroflexota bacterium]
MPVENLLAPAGGGKTAYTISRIRRLRASAPLAPVWVVLPNFPQVASFRRRLARAGGALGVEVGTFYRFYAYVLARAGTLALSKAEGPPPRLDDAVQHRLLRAIVDRLCDEGRLQHYAPLRDKPGFIRGLRNLIQELKRARVHRDGFTAAVADQPPRLAELAAIYAAYQDWLVTSNWTDAEGQGWLAALALERDPTLYADLALLIVDGFDEFNPAQLEVLRLLAGRAAETLITLTGDASAGCVLSTAEGLSARLDQPGRTAHRRFARALSVLTMALDVEPAPLPPLPVSPSPLPPSLVHLEKNLFEPGPISLPANGAVTFVEARDRRQEVRTALRWLKARIVYDGMSPHDVALIAHDLSPYRPFLEETAAEFGLPLRLDAGAALLSNPAVAALLSLLSLPVLNWPRRPVIEALASPYFDWSAIFEGELPNPPAPFPTREGGGFPPLMGEGSLAARLDGAARAGLVIQGLDQWREVLDRLAEAAPEAGAAAEEEDLAPSDLPTGEEAAALRRTFDRFVGRITPPPQATIRDYVAWVEGIIGDDPKLAHPSATSGNADSLGIVARAREAERETGGLPFARRDVAALRTLKDVLRGLVLAESLLDSLPVESPNPPPPFPGREGGISPPRSGKGPGEGSVERPSYTRFFDELYGAVEATTYALPPPEAGSILAAPVLHARGLSFRAVVLLGLSEGEFPAAEQEDPLLRESDRALLRERGLVLEPHLRGEEATLFYEAITRARERLLLCRPYLADDGQAWEPSPYWHHLRRLVDAPLRRVRPGEIPPEEAASLQEFVVAAAHAGITPAAEETGDSIDRGWQAALAGAKVVQARLARSPAGLYEGDLSPLATVMAACYGPDHVWSSSRLETYAKCPLHFYVAHVLHLEPRTLPQEGFDRLVLGSIYHCVLEKVYRLAPFDPLPVLPEVAQTVFEDAPGEYGFRPTALWEQQQQEFLAVLEKTVVALEEDRAGYEPYAQELAFGLHGNPPLILHQPETNAEQQTSSIQCPVSSVQIRGYIDRVDRATDGSLRVVDYKAGSSRISARELEEGTRLQLPLYALAVRDALNLGPVTDGFYWHIGSASPSYLRLGQYEGGVEGAVEATIGYVRAYVAAVREGRFPPTPPTGGCPDHCPAVGFCWRYRPRGW